MACDRSNREAVAAVTVLETTGNIELDCRLGLSFSVRERVARYTQLAVLKAHRGINLPVRLIIESRRRFVGPKHIRYTWLMFNAERAKTSVLCNLLGFAASRLRFFTEYGCVRILTRDETSLEAALCDRRAQNWLEEAACGAVPGSLHPEVLLLQQGCHDHRESSNTPRIACAHPTSYCEAKGRP